MAVEASQNVNQNNTQQPASAEQQTPGQPAPTLPPIEPEKELFSWRAPARPFKRRDREFWVTVFAIAAIFGLILFIAEGVMPVLLIISVVFLFYVLSTVEPEEIQYKITTYGVKVATQRNDWINLTRFWFTKRFDEELLVFEMVTIPGRLELVIDPIDKDVLIKTISTYIPHEEAPPSGLDKATNWVAQKFPGNQ